MNPWDVFLFVILPYTCLAIMIFGLGWRWKTDQFGWTSRSSQIYESAWLRWSSPLFHFGILLVLVGHIMGLLIPESWTNAMGISESAYHMVAVIGGSIGAVMTIVGIVGLLIRRFVLKSVRLATSRSDIVMYILLLIPITMGTVATVSKQIFYTGAPYNYRETISPWLRSLFYFHPEVDLMVNVPWQFKAHIVAAFLLFAILPYTRLVHILSAPVGYTTRPYLVYRATSAPVGYPPELQGWRKGTSYEDDIRQPPAGTFVGNYQSASKK